MLQDIINLQDKAVSQLCELVDKRDIITFRAPTGSGKTRMMADFMNRVLTQDNQVVFLVSTLSKANLAQQNFDVFEECKKIYSHLNPFLINTNISPEQKLTIPTDYNIYVLPRDLYKEGSLLQKSGAFKNLLDYTLNHKKLYLIKDECHQATNNLNKIKGYFRKTFNFSATPKGNIIDVNITDEEAENVNLIKKVDYKDQSTFKEALDFFLQKRDKYINELGVHPCLIVQISNKEKAEEELEEIFDTLSPYKDVKWMKIVDKDAECDTNDKIRTRTRNVNIWRTFAKENMSTIDILIFKLCISEGWDIPRACMLYQPRDTGSAILDQQVLGRIRRNPIISNFDSFNKELQHLATTAFAFNFIPKESSVRVGVRLYDYGIPSQSQLKLKTIVLNLTQKETIDLKQHIEELSIPTINKQNIFELHKGLKKQNSDLYNECFKNIKDYTSWFKVSNNINEIKSYYESYICDYKVSMQIEQKNGQDKESSFPSETSYLEFSNSPTEAIRSWLWTRLDNDRSFAFDSKAEQDWAIELDILDKGSIKENVPGSNKTKYLWGKNFLQDSEIRFQYYNKGIHDSYPDFILKSNSDTIHIFEVKSLNKSFNGHIDSDEYEEKIKFLEDCYLACSEKLPYVFYIPIQIGKNWEIHKYKEGKSTTITLDQLKSEIN